MPTSKPPAKSPAGSLATKTKTLAIVRQAKIASEANRKRAEALLAEITRRLLSIAEDFYDIGQALLELKKKSLFVALGYKSFAEMLGARGVMSITQANKLIRV